MDAAIKRKVFDSALNAALSHAQKLSSSSWAAADRTAGTGLVDPSGRPFLPAKRTLKPINYQYSRRAAQKKGSLKTWIPMLLGNDMTAAYERERIVERAASLINDDPHAAGATENIATLIVGSGLMPYPMIDGDALGISKDRVRKLADSARRIYRAWTPFADAGRRMSFQAMQFLALRNLITYGEFLFLVHMIEDPARPYSIAVQAINPMRLKTPSDLQGREDIRDGVQVGTYGEPVAYWIKKGASKKSVCQEETSKNFVRIEARAGHRFKVIHGFLVNDPEQMRGVSFFAPAMKFFRDLSDYLDAELVSNVVTAAFSVFIETGAGNPLNPAQNLSTITDTAYKDDGTSYDQRYQELIPGMIMYGSTGEKPHPIQAQRPGSTFEPFVKTIERSIAASLNIPYAVLFKDVEKTTYASYRSAMLEAWRVVQTRRKWLGAILCQPVYRMLLEEAYLRGRFPVKAFYSRIHELTEATWVGPPKGQIEPVKEVQADALSVQHNFKSREEVLLEQGRDIRTTLDQLEDEQKSMKQKGLDEQEVETPDPNQRTMDGNTDE